MDEIIAINRRNYECCKKGLEDLPGVSLIEYDPNERNYCHYIVVEVDPDTCPLNRGELQEVLLAENVLARKHFWPGRHNMGACRSLQPNAHIIRPETERGSARVMVLPTGQEVSEETVGIICHVIKTALGDAALVKTALQA